MSCFVVSTTVVYSYSFAKIIKTIVLIGNLISFNYGGAQILTIVYFNRLNACFILLMASQMFSSLVA